MTFDWFDWVDDVLLQFDQILPKAPIEVKQEIVERFHRLLDLNDAWLDEWLSLQERIHGLVEKYPELIDGNVSDNQPDTCISTDQKGGVFDFLISEEQLHQFRVGQGFYQLLMFPDAIMQFAQVVDHEPNFLLGRLYLALSFFQQHDWNEAEKHFTFIRDTSPHREFTRFAHHMLGCIAIQREQNREAIHHFSRALEIDAADCDTLFNLGTCYYRLAIPQMAASCFEQALHAKKDDWESMLYLARTYTMLGKSREGAEWLQRAYELSQNPAIITEIAQLFERRGLMTEALDWYLNCVSKHPEWAEGYHGVAWCMWHLKRPREALSWLKKGMSISRDDRNMPFTYWWFSRFIATDDEHRRITHYLSYNNRFPIWDLIRGNIHRLQGDWETAQQTLIPLINAEETPVHIQGAALYQLGHLSMLMQKWRQAVQYFHAARERTVDLYETWLFEGICHYFTGDTEQSERCLELYKYASEQNNGGH